MYVLMGEVAEHYIGNQKCDKLAKNHFLLNF